MKEKKHKVSQPEYSVDLFKCVAIPCPRRAPATRCNCFREPRYHIACSLSFLLALLATSAQTEAHRISEVASRWRYAYFYH